MHASRLCKHLTWNGISQHDIRLYREEHAVSQWYPSTSHHLSIYRNFPKLFPQLLLSSFRSTCVRFLDRKGRRWLPLCLYSRGPHARARNGQTMQRGERVEHHRRSTLYWPRAKYQSKRSAARLLGFCEIILLFPYMDKEGWYPFIELSQMALQYASLRRVVCSQTVSTIFQREFILMAYESIITSSNQHIIISSIPTSHRYISSASREEANFVPQFECWLLD